MEKKSKSKHMVLSRRMTQKQLRSRLDKIKKRRRLYERQQTFNE